MIRLDGSKSSLESLASLRPGLDRLSTPIFVAIPAKINAEKLPPACRGLPGCVYPLLVAGDTPSEEATAGRVLSAAIGRPICGWYVPDWSIHRHASLQVFPDCSPQYLFGYPSLAGATPYRIGARLPIVSLENKQDEWTYLHGRTKSIKISTAAAQLAALQGTTPPPVPMLPPGGWLSPEETIALAAELQQHLRIPQAANVSLSEAMMALAAAIRQKSPTPLLWYRAKPPLRSYVGDALATTFGAVREAANALVEAPAMQIPTSISVSGYPVSPEAYLQTLATLLPKNTLPDNAPILIPRAVPIDDSAQRALLRELNSTQRTTAQQILHTLFWDTAVIGR